MSDAEGIFDVVIIGAGFSGTMVAVHLARTAPGLRVLLADREGAFGRGIAYGTGLFLHLLNVPAAKMSAFPDAPDNFVEWLDFHGPAFRSMGIEAMNPGDFVPRKIYGIYLRRLLDAARGSGTRMEILPAQISDIEPRDGLLHVTAESGKKFLARRAVLALGNFPPGDPPVRDNSFHASPRYLSDPWSPETLQSISRNDDILILGSGLTALDLLVSLQSIKSRGIIHVISRHGLFPQVHRHHQARPMWFADREFPTTIRALLHEVRADVRRGATDGVDWRAIIDALRPHTQRIWQSLPINERRRFIRHLRAIWESHRHRAAPAVLAAKEALLDRSQLLIHRGRVQSIADINPGLQVTLFNRAMRRHHTIRVAYAVNCTGPECNYQKLKSPLVVNLLARGLIDPDPLFLGLNATSAGAVIDYLGNPSTEIFTLGSAAKGMFFETTAVPELRVQAKNLAERLSNDLAHAG